MITLHHMDGAFSSDECAMIVSACQDQTPKDARVLGQRQDHNLRRADLVWLDDVPHMGWVMDRIIDLVRQANRDAFDFDLRSFSESAQVARYGSEREGHFDWHADIGDGPIASKRKLTMVVQLSTGEDYEGGSLDVMPSSQTVSAKRDKGCATVFPSFLLHRVTPVTKGERYSLTIWAHGPAFR